jgi:hypothetical protein
MAVNVVILDGEVKSLTMKSDAQSKPELRFTLAQATGLDGTGQPWVSYWPCCASGTTAERLGTELEDGQHIVITSGKLCYRKRATKTGEVSRMEILVWQVDRLSDGDHAYASPGDTANAMPDDAAVHHEVPSVPDAKQGKPHDPKWHPEPTRQGAAW